MKYLAFFTFALFFVACGGASDNDSSSRALNEREEAPPAGEAVTNAQKKAVVGSMLAGLNLAVALPDSFVATKCETIKEYYDTRADPGCAHSCHDAEIFQRNCSGVDRKAFCGSEVFNMNYQEHLLTWDMTGMDEEFQGKSIFEIHAQGEVFSSEVAQTTFDCQMLYVTDDTTTLQELACDEDFEIDCQVNGEGFGCEQLLQTANESLECVGN